MQTPEELVLAGTGDIFRAPVGTPLPEAIGDPLNAAFRDLGYTNEDGVTLSWTPEITEFKAWQSRSSIRRELTGEEVQLAFSLLQWNADTFAFAFGGGEVTETSPGEYRYDFLGDDDQLGEDSLIAEWRDGTKRYLLVIPRGNITEATETQLNRAALGELPISFKALAPGAGDPPAYLLTNDPAFEPQGS